MLTEEGGNGAVAASRLQFASIYQNTLLPPVSTNRSLADLFAEGEAVLADAVALRAVCRFVPGAIGVASQLKEVSNSTQCPR